MKEIREVAKAYYENSTEQQKKEAQDAFQKMKSENNNTISLTDFLDIFLPDSFPKSVACSLFEDQLDVNRDGILDFNEFITLFYLHQSKRLLYCHGCEKFLTGLYFTCVKCFDSTSNSYDICSLCYQNKNLQHHTDAVFLDNYALLRRKKPSSETAVDPIQESDEINEDVHEYEQENEEVANASNQEKTENRNIAANMLPRNRKRDRIFKGLAKLGVNVTSKVSGRISSTADSSDCSLM
ncbi:uncharacterized protein LOC122319185 [Carya illinoinensis]|uniref:uncharacterized protein LOC122319185 n=1 Tax=Carya illinoinensis TaxID=32201 RepID=UPI001C71FB05|nr:uncharacterized protein LOC122319185 [Carya illinoinensis]